MISFLFLFFSTHICSALSAIGIDLGSSAVKLAAIQYGTSSFELIYDKGSERIFKPSFAFYNEEYYFSHEAEKLLVRCPECVITSITDVLLDKKTPKELTDRSIHIGKKDFSILEISALFFTYLKETASVQLNESISTCAIAIPEDSSDVVKASIRLGAFEGGWQNVYLFSGLFASSLYYALQNRSMASKSTVSLINFGHRLTTAVTFEMTPKNDTDPLSIKYIGMHSSTSGISGRKYERAIFEAILEGIPKNLKLLVIGSQKAIGALMTKIPGIKKTLSFKNCVSVTSDIYDQDDQELNVTIDGAKIIGQLEDSLKETSKFISDYISEHKADIYVAIGAHQRSVPIQNLTKSLNISFINSINPEDCVAFGSAFLAAREHPSFRTYTVNAHDFLNLPVCVDIEDAYEKVNSICLADKFLEGKLSTEFQINGRQFKISHSEDKIGIWHVRVDAPFECARYKLWLDLGNTAMTSPLSLECMDMEKSQDILLKGKEVFDIQESFKNAIQGLKDTIKSYQDTETRKSLLSAIKNTIESIEIELLSSASANHRDRLEAIKSKLETPNLSIANLDSLFKEILATKDEISLCKQRYDIIDKSLANITDSAILTEVRRLFNNSVCLDTETYEKCSNIIQNFIAKAKNETDKSAAGVVEGHVEL